MADDWSRRGGLVRVCRPPDYDPTAAHGLREYQLRWGVATAPCLFDLDVDPGFNSPLRRRITPVMGPAADHSSPG